MSGTIITSISKPRRVVCYVWTNNARYKQIRNINIWSEIIWYFVKINQFVIYTDKKNTPKNRRAADFTLDHVVWAQFIELHFTLFSPFRSNRIYKGIARTFSCGNEGPICFLENASNALKTLSCLYHQHRLSLSKYVETYLKWEIKKNVGYHGYSFSPFWNWVLKIPGKARDTRVYIKTLGISDLHRW